MSALPPKADIAEHRCHVHFLLIAEMAPQRVECAFRQNSQLTKVLAVAGRPLTEHRR